MTEVSEMHVPGVQWTIEQRLIAGTGVEVGAYVTTEPGVYWNVRRICLLDDIEPAAWLIALKPADAYEIVSDDVNVIELPRPWEETAAAREMPELFGVAA